MDDVLKLPESMDVARARAVANDLIQHRGDALTIDASEVTKISALAVEILLASAKQWQTDGHPFSITPSSPAFMTTLDDLGVLPELVGVKPDAAMGASDDESTPGDTNASGGTTDDTERGQS